MIEDIVGSNGTKFVIAAAAVAAGLLCLVIVFWFMRNRPSSPFLRGGKNRQPRLAVLDAAAVDTRRRLVLVRRDDVEHLIMIGGPTDIVIESRIMPAVTASAPADPVQLRATTDRQPPAQPVSSQASRLQPAQQQPAPQLTVQQPSPQLAAPQQPVRQAEPRLPPVSAMGQALYGDVAETPSGLTARPSPARIAPQPIARQPSVDRAAAVPAQQRPTSAAPVAQAAVGSPTGNSETPARDSARTPEDILDAARARVLSSSVSDTTPAKVASSQPVQATPAASMGSETRNNVSAVEFERILDAEITGDLGRLAPGAPVRDQLEQRAAATQQPSAGMTGRQDPRMETESRPQRTEPSLEEEMNRMLNEISANRKP